MEMTPIDICQQTVHLDLELTNQARILENQDFNIFRLTMASTIIHFRQLGSSNLHKKIKLGRTLIA